MLKIINPYQGIFNSDIKVSKNYKLKYTEEKEVYVMQTDDFKEMLEYVNNTKKNKFVIIYNDDLSLLFKQIKENYKHKPFVCIDRGQITNIVTKLIIDKNEVSINIKKPFDNIDHILGEKITTKNTMICFMKRKKNYFQNI